MTATNPYKTPGNFGPKYDWRKEPWFIEVSCSAELAGLRIAVALQADGDGPQDEEDNKVLALVEPHIADAVCRSTNASEHIRYRLAHAIAVCIDKTFKEVASRNN